VARDSRTGMPAQPSNGAAATVSPVRPTLTTHGHRPPMAAMARR